MDLIAPEIGLFVWSSVVLIMIILPILALISILKNRFKDNDKLNMGFGRCVIAFLWFATLFYNGTI